MAKGAYIGVAKQTYKNSLGDLAVGSTVNLKVNGTAREFLIVHQGRPSTLYDSSCNGTWLLMKDIYENRQWHSSNVNDYANSTIHSYLNSTFLNLFETNIREVIKQVKLPYRAGSGTSKTVTSGANGLSAKIFLLSSTEVSFNHDYMPTNEGVELSYFAGCVDNGNDSKRVANYNGSATYWWLRSPHTYYSISALDVSANGGWRRNDCSSSYGIRPALVLPSNLSAANGIVTGEVAESVSTGIARKIKKGYVGVYTQSDVVTTVTGGPASSTCSESKPVWDTEQSKYVLPSGGYVTSISDLRDNYAPDPPPVYYIITDRTTYYSVDESTSTTTYKKCVRVAGPVARKIKKGYIGVGGVARPFWSGGELAYYGTITPLMEGRTNIAAASVGEYAIFFGGTIAVASPCSTVEIYSKSLTLTSIDYISNAQRNAAASSIPNYAIFGGGYTSNYTGLVVAYDSSLTRHTPIGLDTNRAELAATSIGGYALFGGGLGSLGGRSDVETYNNSLTRGKANGLSIARYALAATSVGNYALFCGGEFNNGGMSDVDAYDSMLTHTIPPNKLSLGRRALAAATAKNHALFAGGYSGSSSAYHAPNVDVYSDSLTKGSSIILPVGRSYLAATSVGEFAVFGGGLATISNVEDETNAVDVFDASLTNKSSSVSALSEKKYHVAAATIGNYALFGGGYSYDNGNIYHKTVDVYTTD